MMSSFQDMDGGADSDVTPYCATNGDSGCGGSKSLGAINNNTHTSSCNSSFDGSPAPNSQAHPFANDSGNYSSCSGSDAGVVADTQYAYERFQYLLREKDQALFAALEELRKLRSELDRLSKSEQWYKQELRSQKASHVEALERFYGKERQYVQVNQRLQNECIRLYEKCSELERDLELKRVERSLSADFGLPPPSAGSCCDGDEFQMEQQKALIGDQQQLIAVLRKQKRALLKDMERLTEEKDSAVLGLQSSLASMEVDAAVMSQKCEELLRQRKQMEERLHVQANNLQLETAEKEKLHQLIGELMKHLEVEEHLVASKETQFAELRQTYRAHAQRAGSPRPGENEDDDGSSAKAREIVTLKASLLALQEELVALAELQSQREQQDHIIDDLNGTLQRRLCELDELKQSDEVKALKIAELQTNLLAHREEHDRLLEELHRTQVSLRETQTQLIAENNQYATMCAMCETTRFELEVREIELRKAVQRSASDEQEVAHLREQLHTYLSQTRELSERINVLEQQLAEQNEEKDSLLQRLQEMEEILSEATERTPSPERGAEASLAKKIDRLERVNQQLLEELNGQHDTIERKNALIAELQQPSSSHNCPAEDQTAVESAESLREVLRQKSELCETLAALLRDKCHTVRKLQQSLLATDGRLYKMLRHSAGPKDVAESEAALEECRRLRDQLQLVRAAEESIRSQLEAAELEVAALKETTPEDLKEPWRVAMRMDAETETGRTAMVDQSSQTQEEPSESSAEEEAAGSLDLAHQNAQTEVDQLKCELKLLQLNLAEVMSDQMQKQARRVDFMNDLLQQQKEREVQFRAHQDEWEEIVRALQISRELEENTRRELQEQRDEFEKLNELFGKQNEQLRLMQARIDGQQPVEREGEKKGLENVQLGDPQEVLAKQLQSDDKDPDWLERGVFLCDGIELPIKQHLRAFVADMEQVERKRNEELLAIQGQLKDVTQKYECSQSTVKSLEEELRRYREEYVLKALASSGSNPEESNLIDDYKKLIQKSALATLRPGTSEVLGLIQKSDNFVPSLEPLVESIDKLREDMHRVLHATHSTHN